MEEYDAFDSGPGHELYKSYGGTGFLPYIVMGEQRVTGPDKGGVISSIAAEFGPEAVRKSDRRALGRNFDALLGSGTPLLYHGYARMVGFNQ